MSSGGIFPDGKVYCRHMEEAARRKSTTPSNPNREFYCCKRPPGDKTKCNFWYWADKVPQANLKDTLPVVASNPSTVLTPAPSPTKEGGTRTHLTSTPPTRPQQTHCSPSDSPSEMLRPKKRLENITAGLRQRKQDLSPIRPQAGLSMEPGPSTSLFDIQTIPQPPSPVPTEVDCEPEPQPRRSFLGLEQSPEPVTSTINVEDQPSTPKKRRLTPPAEGTTIQPAADAVAFGGELPLTPPQTTRRVPQFGGLELVSATHSRKGKERESASPEQAQNQDDHGGLQKDSLPLFTLPEDISSTSSASPTPADNVLDYTDGIKARVKALSEYMDSFDITQAAKLLQTTERQKTQYECRDRGQKKCMEELVAEKDWLVAEVARLKEALQRSEESNRVKDAEIASLTRKGL